MTVEVKRAFPSSNPRPRSSLSSSLVWELPGYAISSSKPRRGQRAMEGDWMMLKIELNVIWKVYGKYIECI